MLYRISQRIVCVWQSEHIIPIESSEAYVYGVQLLLSTLLNIICIAIISGLATLPFAWIPFLAGFIPLRITAGGFHAKTPLRCFFSFCGSYFIFIAIALRLPESGMQLAILVNSIVTVLAVYLCSPIPAANKPLSDEEIPQKRMLSFVVASVLLLFSLSSIKLNTALFFTLCMTSGELVAAVFLVIGKVKNRNSEALRKTKRRKEKRNEKEITLRSFMFVFYHYVYYCCFSATSRRNS